MTRMTLFRIAVLIGIVFANAFGIQAAHASNPADLKVGSSTLTFAVAPNYSTPTPSHVRVAVQLASQAVVTYFGEFPVKSLLIELAPNSEAEDIFGMVVADATKVRLSIGSNVTPTDLFSDWTITHEFVHLSFPKIGQPYKWIREGLSTYVEPLARAQARQVDGNLFWPKMIKRTPDALGPNGETDFATPTSQSHFQKWVSRTYWGGALFWLCVEIELHEKTQGKVSLQQMLKGIVKKGGNGQAFWTTDKLFEVAREISGTDVLKKQFQRFSGNTDKIDLKAIWKKLGIALDATGNLQLDASAPLAGLRESLTKPH